MPLRNAHSLNVAGHAHEETADGLLVRNDCACQAIIDSIPIVLEWRATSCKKAGLLGERLQTRAPPGFIRPSHGTVDQLSIGRPFEPTSLYSPTAKVPVRCRCESLSDSARLAASVGSGRAYSERPSSNLCKSNIQCRASQRSTKTVTRRLISAVDGRRTARSEWARLGLRLGS